MGQNAPAVQKLDIVEFTSSTGTREKGIVIGWRDPRGLEEVAVLRIWHAGKEVECKEPEVTVVWSIKSAARGE
jgi:hypothetical protein